MKKLKLYIIGSISTRACFDYIPENIYTDIYEVTGVQYQSSFISLMSNPIDKDSLDTSSLSKWSQKVIERDLSKTFKEELIKSKPDYIIVDLISEIEYGVIKTPDSYITKISGKTNKLDLKDLCLEEISFKDKKEIYMELFKNKIDKFKMFCKDELPQTKIIFHIAPFLYSYFDDCRVAKSFINKNLLWKNKSIKELYEYCTSETDLIIDTNDKTYFATTKHRVSLNPIHYETQYYIDFISELNIITLKDLLERG